MLTNTQWPDTIKGINKTQKIKVGFLLLPHDAMHNE